MKKPDQCSHIAKRIAESIDTIGMLADILHEATMTREAEEGAELINARGEYGIQAAIRLLSRYAHSDFCEMATDLGIPECN